MADKSPIYIGDITTDFIRDVMDQHRGDRSHKSYYGELAKKIGVTRRTMYRLYAGGAIRGRAARLVLTHYGYKVIDDPNVGGRASAPDGTRVVLTPTRGSRLKMLLYKRSMLLRTITVPIMVLRYLVEREHRAGWPVLAEMQEQGFKGAKNMQGEITEATP